MVAKIALTDAYLRKLKPNGKRFEATDTTVSGLRVRVSASGQVTFALKTRNAASQLVTVTIGQYPDISLKDAREEATRRRLELKAGRDINAEKRLLREATRNPSTAPTLREILREFEQAFGATKKVWSPAGTKTSRTQAGRVVERVFADILDQDVTKITEDDLAQAIMSYKRAKPIDGKTKANGQASKARGYLGPVLDWVSGRKSYAKIGASRRPRLEVASLANIHDPATTDSSITGKRTRVLTQDELQVVLPLLKFPAPKLGNLRLSPDTEFRPIAMRFILFTAARLEEVCAMRWRDLDRRNRVWHKPRVKSTKGGPRSQNLPLSAAAFDILKGLPGWLSNTPDAFVFPNGTGKGKLGNWQRVQDAIYGETGTSGWQRHDLRRTAATLMYNLKVPASTIEQILAHADPLKGDNVGGAASHYLQLTQVMRNTRDPQEEALSTLAEVLSFIEDNNG